MKARAIFNCIYFGIMPWWVYERNRPHYDCTYREHLNMNMMQAWIWFTNLYVHEDVSFERMVNPTWGVVFQKMFRWTKYRKTGVIRR
jgi:hypothetical protein